MLNIQIIFTKRERDCLPYLAQGLTYKHIGKMLGLSHRTVEAYVKSMRVKIGAASKKELIQKAIAH